MKVKKSRNVPGTYPTRILISAELRSVTLNPKNKMETKTLIISGTKLSRQMPGMDLKKSTETNSMVEPQKYLS